MTVVDNGCTWENLEKWGIAIINGHTYTGEFKYWATETKVELEYTKDDQTVRANITNLFDASNNDANAEVTEGVQTNLPEGEEGQGRQGLGEVGCEQK